MKLDPAYDIAPLMLDPEGEIEEFRTYNGMNEYGFAVGTEIEQGYNDPVDETLVRRMDNEVLRNLAAFAQKNPELDLSAVQLVEGPKMPVGATNNDWSRYTATKEEREASYQAATKFSYTRGWYVVV